MGKKYQVYVKPKARKSLATRSAVKALNTQLGAGVVKVTTNKAAADAIVGLGLGGTKHSGQTTRGTVDRIQINKAAKLLPKSAYRRVISHEIGHGLGLAHRQGQANLMNPNTGGKNLVRKQQRRVRQMYNKGGYR